MEIGVAIIGAGAIALANHLPGLKLCPQARVVALCDANRETLEKAGRDTGVTKLYSEYKDAIADPNVQAVIIATPNFLHPEIAIAAAKSGKHILCEKPLGLNLKQVLQMLDAARKANVRHMTAFTYRFVPAMRWMKHLVDQGDIGTIYHFRAQRFQDWWDRPLGWRQVKKLAGTGEMGDMLSHRIDYGHHLVGRIERLVADLRTIHHQRGGQPSDVDDWVGMLAQFESNATGVLESTKLATGRGEGLRGADVVEVNGSEGSIAYSTQKPLELWIGKKKDPELKRFDVPNAFLVWPGSPREPGKGDPVVTFRYDQDVEFIQAILEKRDCRPSFVEGAMTQAVMDSALQSANEKRWVDVERIK